MLSLRKSLRSAYEVLPGKPLLMRALRSSVRVPERIYRHLHFKGVIEVPVDGRSFRLFHHGHQVENTIFWSGLRGDWEGASLDLWCRLCRDAETILDIGANTGVYALVAKTLRPSADVRAFEPVSRVYSKLVENCRLNGFDIHCEEVALSDHEGTAKIFDTAADHTYSVTVNKNTLPAGVTAIEATIQITTLDQYIRSHDLKSVDLMKIDVETHEPEMLAGFKEGLARFRPTMLVEILTDEIGAHIQSVVEPLGYRFFAIDERRGLSPSSTIRRGPGLNFLLCQPAVAARLDLG